MMDQLAQALPGWVPLTGSTICNGPDCDFSAIIRLLHAGIQDLVVISTFIVIALLAYTGIKLLFSGGNSGAMTAAKSALTSVIIGYIWILSAWLIVYTITSLLLKTGYSLLGP